MSLSALPHFTVDAVRLEPTPSEAVLTGRFSHLRGIRNTGGWLYRQPGPSLTASLPDLPRAAHEAVDLRVHELALAPELAPGTVYPWIDEYWQAYHVDMILAHEWERRPFVATAARYFRQAGVTGWQPEGAELPEGAEDLGVRAGAWDHEHCELCHAHIGAGGASSGYVDPLDHWLCEACYQRYAIPRDVSFAAEP